ncbi:leucine-rich repeat domain-containing protein [Blautia sp. RTP21359st1_E11_RTP21359_211015]|uniref:leucine-rich repeat domain-containing protein n=1 Tax=Blautia sp. RTP21359st1_E11_RTP21359_211015 TaxID=3141591 RepID=UPI0034A1ECBF
MDEKRDVIFTKSFDCIIDMDVKHGIKRVEIDCNVYMQHTKKSFPDVEELMIGPDVDEICIPNTLFPNVQMVYSDSIFFLAGRYLVKKRNGRPTLLNAFCKDEALEISVIVSIADYALANSNIKKIPYNYSALIRCEPMAFKDSYFEKQPFVNGVKTAGRIIVAIDPEADEVILPDEEYSMAVCAVGVNLADVKHLVIHNPNSICAYSIKGVPKEVTFVTTQETHYNHIINVMHAAKPGDGYYVEKVNIIDKNGKFVEKDGVVYTADMKRLIACSLSVTDLVTPEGVEEIISYAFANTRIKNVKFPDSLAILNENAFYKCRELQNVDFGSGLDIIKGFAFQNCTSLTHVKLPPQMKSIERYAFGDSGVKNVELNEGLLLIHEGVFSGCKIDELRLPDSLENIGTFTDASGIKCIKSSHFIKDIPLNACRTGASSYLYDDEFDVVFRYDCGNKTVFLPRFVKKSDCYEFQTVIEGFLQEGSKSNLENLSLYKYANTIEGRERTAYLEYLEFHGEEQKAFLKKHGKQVFTMLLSESTEEAIKFLGLNILTPKAQKEVLEIVNKGDNPVLSAAVLEMMNNGKGIRIPKSKFSV